MVYVSTDEDFSDGVVCPRYIVNQWEGVAWRYYCDSLGKYISVENVNIDEFNSL